ncbi:ThiF family adenylyltransferase [Agromyces archimandritae]|uniref:ThiF family adenylyltransferase n=1 Tax=Agromyces archimandritae TaxID=2781962 RepID=A0A975FL11_9MICO|nr:ThiF family adenylyltransferase [Agromyces archimandritae]QTX03867.1 ThiF family adenylyltransferase [Agromyces archimandritae]
MIRPLVEPGAEPGPAETLRTARQTRLPGIGPDGARRIAAARVLVLGAGGLGSPVLLSLAGAGVGTLGIVDDDEVARHNLHRQLLFGVDDIGTPKTAAAARRIAGIAPDTVVHEHRLRLDEAEARRIFTGYDLVVDGTDNFATRYLADSICDALGLPLVWGAAVGYDAQVTVFWRGAPAGRATRLTDLHPSAPADAPNCEDAGVLGPLTAQTGALMAAEVLKLVTGVGDPLLGRMVSIDARSALFREIPLRAAGVDAGATADAGVAANTTAVDAGPHPTGRSAPAASAPRISVRELRERLAARDAGRDAFTLLDVREAAERAERSIPGSIHRPLDMLDPAGIDRAHPVIVHCHGEARAERAAASLSAAGLDVAVLRGGIVGWSES